MKIKAFTRWATLCALCLAPLAASANDKDKSDTTSSTTTKTDTTKNDTTRSDTKAAKLSESELQIVAHVHHVNQMEIDAGKLAEKSGSSQAIKSYGQMLVKDHGQADRDLTAFMKKHNQKIPMEKATNESDKTEMKDDKDAMNRLKNMKGADFDREFLTMMVQGHDKELAKIDSEVGQINDNDLSTMLKDMKPVLQRHADQARELQKNNAQAMK
jgi:predicted outer membrane protein